MWPGCERLTGSEERNTPCPEHQELWESQAENEDLGYAWSILVPWVEAARAVGNQSLTEVMESALEELNEKSWRAQEQLEEAEAAL